MRSLRDMANPYQHAPKVSIVRTLLQQFRKVGCVTDFHPGYKIFLAAQLLGA